MGFAEFFNFKGPVEDSSTELPEIFPFLFKKDEFVRIDVTSIYSKILTDVVERTHGLKDEQVSVLWDNCLKSTKQDGLISMLSKAIFGKNDLFIVYDSAIGIVREATQDEKNKIKADYEKTAESSIGIFISFKNFARVDMVKLYSELEFNTIGSLFKNMNLAKAIQLKMKDLRASTALVDSGNAVAQAKSIAIGLSKGQDALLDAGDEIVTATPQLDATKSAIDFLASKRAFYLGLPAAYITGDQTGGLNGTGSTDARAVERGLRNYFYAIVKPVLEDLFDVKVKFKPQDTRQITDAMNALKTFTLVDDSLVSHETKKAIIESLLDIDPDDNETEEPGEPRAEPIAQIPPPSSGDGEA